MKITNLNKRYGKNIIFENASFDFEDGKITYIMGESGKGKTTLLRIVAGIDTDFIGEISKPERLAYVFQEPRLFPALTVLKNIELVNDTPFISAKDLLSILELNGCENMLPSELSGGMKQRVSIARAIYYNADAILMDEPFASIDEDMKNRLIPKIFELLKNKTVIIVSHDIADAQKYADKIIKI